jgi:hypothetical protein
MALGPWLHRQQQHTGGATAEGAHVCSCWYGGGGGCMTVCHQDLRAQTWSTSGEKQQPQQCVDQDHTRMRHSGALHGAQLCGILRSSQAVHGYKYSYRNTFQVLSRHQVQALGSTLACHSATHLFPATLLDNLWSMYLKTRAAEHSAAAFCAHNGMVTVRWYPLCTGRPPTSPPWLLHWVWPPCAHAARQAFC